MFDQPVQAKPGLRIVVSQGVGRSEGGLFTDDRLNHSMFFAERDLNFNE
jgi:hypothetical protein